MDNDELKLIARRLVKKHALKEWNEGFKPTGLHRYDDEKGNLIYFRLRLKHSDARKWIRPFHFDSAVNDWVIGEPKFSTKKPLYRLPALAGNPQSEAWVVEGELKVDELEKLDFIATTSGGSTSAPDANWEPLRGRNVVIWRDNDEAGINYFNDVIKILHSLDCAIRCIEIDSLNLPDGGDVVDWLSVNPNATSQDILALPTNIWRCTEKENSNQQELTRASTVELICASNIVPEAISWFWDGWLAAGKMHILGGAPGTGKTTISIALAATITCGGRWPDGSRASVGNVLIWSGEDDPKDTLVPRLLHAKADLDRVFFIAGIKQGETKRSFDPANDLELLQEKLKGVDNIKLLIIDPIVSAITGDSHKNAEVRRDLQPLVDMAVSQNFALLGITHFSKGTSGRDPVERLTGSLAFGAMARIVLVAVKQQDNEADHQPRLFLRAKSNIGSDSGGFEYELKQGELDKYPGIISSSILWGVTVEGSARELLSRAESMTTSSKTGSLEEAKIFLTQLLLHGRVESTEIEQEAKATGHSPSTIRRAKLELGIKAKKEGSKWYCQLPFDATLHPSKLKMIKDDEDAQPNNLSTFNNFEQLKTSGSDGYKEFHMRDKQNLSPPETSSKLISQTDCRAVADKIEVIEEKLTNEMRRLIL